MVKRGRLLYGIIGGIALIVFISGFLLYHWHAEIIMSRQMQEKSSTLDLGIVYLPVTQKVVDYYGLGVGSGALVTYVVEGGLVDRAGIKTGDVIVSFDGNQISEAAPLLGMVRSCPMGHDVTLMVWENGNFREVNINHSGQ